MSDGTSERECSNSSNSSNETAGVSFSVRQVGARGVRRGELRVGGGACVATPAFVTPTVKGYVPHTTPQLLAETAMPRVLGVALADLVDDAALVDAAPAGARRGTLWGAGAAAAHAGAVLYACTGAAAPLRPPTINARHLVGVASKRGHELVAPARLVALARAPGVAAHVLEAPALECAHDESPSRHGKCEAATLAILDQCLAAAAGAAGGAQEEEKKKDGGLAVVACVLGGVSAKQRRAAAEHVAARAGVFGYCLGELGLGESQAEREAALQAALPCLDAARLRVTRRIAAPADVLQLVAHGAVGIDLFVTDWPERLARAGYALCFPLPSEGVADSTKEGGKKEEEKEEEEECFPGSDGTKFSMDGTALVDDHRVLVCGCGCHACRNGYTRAYLHHLRNTHEMLADILLTQHNQHHYAAFFAALRAAADADTLDALMALYCH